MSNIHISVHKTGLEEYTARSISGLLKTYANKSILLLVSGGSARGVLEYLDESVLGMNLTVSQVDERFSREETVSNFLQFSHTSFYTRARAHGVAFISSLPEEGETIESVSERWDRTLHEWVATHQDNSMVVALMGMGADGHIGGVVPMGENPATFTALFKDSTRWIRGYDAGSKNPYSLRMTSTMSFLETVVDQAFLFVKGEEKREILEAVLESRDVPLYPAAVIHTMKHVEVCTSIDCK